jgi:hypothetical protein
VKTIKFLLYIHITEILSPSVRLREREREREREKREKDERRSAAQKEITSWRSV